MNFLHFSKDEFLARQRETCRRLELANLDGLLLFRQESMFYLTGYDTSGYTMFQAGYIGANGKTALLTRTADRLQSRMTSIFEDIRIWIDGEDAMPGHDLKQLLADYGCENKRIGVEYHAYGLTGQRAKMIDDALQGFCTLVDASDIVREQRLVKSPAELEYVRQAGHLSDAIFDVSVKKTRPGVEVKSIYGAMMNTLMLGGGDPTASRWPMGAGQAALFGRYHTGNEVIGDNDQVVFEPAASYRHYHSCAMYNILTGSVPSVQADMNHACAEAIDACQKALRPGTSVGELFEVHTQSLTHAGFGDAALAACGYTLGATYPPTWMDWPMIWKDNPAVLEAGMVIFLHMILFDKPSGLSMCIGETAIVTDGECERINHTPRTPILATID